MGPTYGTLAATDIGYPRQCIMQNPRNAADDWTVSGVLVAVLHTLDASGTRVSQVSMKVAGGQIVNFTIPSDEPINDAPVRF